MEESISQAPLRDGAPDPAPLIALPPVRQAPEGLELHGQSRDQLRALAKDLGEPSYRGDQLFEWVWRKRFVDPSAMTNLPLRFRERLAELSLAGLPEVIEDKLSVDGTRKLLLRLRDGYAIECVLIPAGDRLTLCVSTQVGCALACKFCATGTMGFLRNLTAGEVLGQVLLADHVTREAQRQSASTDAREDHREGGQPDHRLAITNLVLMGMGEPLLNPKNVARAIAILREPKGANFSSSRITLSTVGVRSQLWSFLEETGVNLAISLHAATSSLRASIMPIEHRHKIADLLGDLRERWSGRSNKRVTFEYVLLKDVNDSVEEARALAELLRGIDGKVNLLAYNPHPDAPYERPSDARVDRFRDALVRAGVDAYIRRSRGRDIDAACGQLAVKPKERGATIGR